MSELEILAQRREAVMLSATLQRSIIEVRLNRIERHPLQTALGFSMDMANKLPLKQLALTALGIGFRYMRRRG